MGATIAVVRRVYGYAVVKGLQWWETLRTRFPTLSQASSSVRVRKDDLRQGRAVR
jgi:hypothetical protein